MATAWEGGTATLGVRRDAASAAASGEGDGDGVVDASPPPSLDVQTEGE
jgi:hypothetical protein